jgi:hypothetical protein
MRIVKVFPQPNSMLSIIADDGRIGNFDTSRSLKYEAFEALQNHTEFLKVFNGGYFVEWDCGADLSTDAIEARWQVVGKTSTQATA